MIHDTDVLPGKTPGGASFFGEEPKASRPTAEAGRADQPPITDSRQSTPPDAHGPFQVQFIGRRGGLPTLQVNVGRHTIRIYADKRGIAARPAVEMDGRRLVKKRARRRWHIWSKDIIVQRWVVGSAAEFVDDQPRWSYQQIAANLKKSGRAVMSYNTVWQMVRRLAPELAARRAAYYNADARRRSLPRKLAVPTNNPWKKKAARKAIRDELKKAGLL